MLRLQDPKEPAIRVNETTLNLKAELATAKKNMQKSLAILATEIDPSKKQTSLANLHLNKEQADPGYKCFDDIWEIIETNFLKIEASSQELDEKTHRNIKDNLKNCILLLIQAGIPFVNNHSLCFWSTDFARLEAERFARLNNAVTDGMAHEHLRKALEGWSSIELPVLHPIITGTNKPAFPRIGRLFWEAMSEVYAEQAKKNQVVHLFFQDCIVVGSVFWNIELKALRRSGAVVMMHRYNSDTHEWEAPYPLDSEQSNATLLRRKFVHSSEEVTPDLTTTMGTQLLWRQKFKSNDKIQEMEKWCAPAVLTLGKLTLFARKFKSKALAKYEPLVMGKAV